MLDQRVRESFARIAASEPAFKAWLEAERTEVFQQLASCIAEPQLRQAQGKAQFLEQLLERLNSKR